MNRNVGMKIAVLCLPGLETFLKDIVRHFSSGYEVKTCYSTNVHEIQKTIAWADTVWLEWANELTIGITANPGLLNGKRVICRLHSYEVFENYIERINWNKIDDLIFVAPHIRDIAGDRFARLKSQVRRIHIIPNGIDCSRFTYLRRNPGHCLAFIGNINYKKGPMLLLHAFQELVQLDRRYTLHVAGRFQNERYTLYFKQMMKEMRLQDNIRLDGWVEDVSRWLQDKQYVVCSSVLEGHPVGIMEAMACGLKPMIHNFFGAGGIFPDQFLWNTIPEFVQKVTCGNYDSSAYRDYVKDNFSLEKQLRKIDRLMAGELLPAQEVITLRDGNTADPAQTTNSADRPNRTSMSALHPKVRKTLDKCVRPGMDVLVVGCHGKEVADYIGRMDARVAYADESRMTAQDEGQFNLCSIAHYRGPYEQMHLNKKFDLIAIIRVLEKMPATRIPGFMATMAEHAKSTTVIYLNMMDGRYLRHASPPGHHCQSGEICNRYGPDEVLALFARHGLQTYHIEFYGEDVPVQYNGYLFTTGAAFKRAVALFHLRQKRLDE